LTRERKKERVNANSIGGRGARRKEERGGKIKWRQREDEYICRGENKEIPPEKKRGRGAGAGIMRKKRRGEEKERGERSRVKKLMQES